VSFNVGVVGLGVIGQALLETLHNSKIDAERILIFDKSEDKSKYLSERYGFHQSSLDQLISQSRILFIVVKPQDLDYLFSEMDINKLNSKLLVSFVAGRTTSSIEKVLNEGQPVLRVMPNTPMLVGVGASAISKGKYASDNDVEAIQELLKVSGKTIVVDESLQDAVTATSGSGPAYFFRFVEAMISGAQELGLSESDARSLVIQTITGAAAMLNQEGADPGLLRQNVTSPNGTTYAALQVFEGGDLEGLIKRAMKAARDRSRELS